MPQQYSGLSDREVDARRQAGQVNVTKRSIAKPLSRIILDNTCTLFNLVNVLIAAALIAVHSYHNLLFFGVALCNTAIGIIQELRSKHALEKLSLLCQSTARVNRNGETTIIPVSDIVKDDILVFESGDQIGVDAAVLSGEAEIDESLLTGEADPVLKRAGDCLLSGSFVVSGRCVAVATAVGDDSYAAALTAQAKRYTRLQSPLLHNVNQIIRFSGLFSDIIIILSREKCAVTYIFTYYSSYMNFMQPEKHLAILKKKQPASEDAGWKSTD
ncbi:MAG: hypothetical protein IKV35_03010, partial [Clostridia bacterium]|nr:hypothetical protein [Clostridia bacterium]